MTNGSGDPYAQQQQQAAVTAATTTAATTHYDPAAYNYSHSWPAYSVSTAVLYVRMILYGYNLQVNDYLIAF